MNEELKTTLASITQTLGTYHSDKARAERQLQKARTQFFDTINQALGERRLATRLIDLPSVDPDRVEGWVKLHYPGWRIQSIRPDEKQLAIEEDPAFKPFTFVNPVDGKVYSRQISQGGPSVDDERLRQENPELYMRVTRLPTERELRPVSEMKPDDFAALEPYLIPDKLTPKLAAPRKAKPEELEEAP